MPQLTPEEQERVIDGLVGLGWLPTIDSQSIGAVRAALPGVTNDAEAKVVLDELFSQGLVHQEIERGGELTGRPVPLAQSRWVRTESANE